MSAADSKSKKAILSIGCGDALAAALQREWRFSPQFELRAVPTLAAAVRELASRTFDICVLDSTAAGDPWPATLRALQRDHPSMARVMLASAAERERFVEGLWLTHSFLPRVCDKRLLRSTLLRVAELQDLIAVPGMRSIIAKIEHLPVTGGTERKLMYTVHRAEVSAAEIARIVESDVALSAKVLQLVNSSYFGLGKKIGSIHQAVSYAGIAVMKSLAMTAQLQSLFARPASEAATQEVHQHSLLVGRVTRQLLGRHPSAEMALATGLMHDLGALVITLSGCATSTTGERRLRHRANDDARDVGHAALGGLLAHLWGFPDVMCEAIALHHEPHRAGRSELDLLTALHFADAIVYSHSEGVPLAGELDVPHLSKLGIMHRVDEYVKTASDLLEPASQQVIGRASRGASSLMPTSRGSPTFS